MTKRPDSENISGNNNDNLSPSNTKNLIQLREDRKCEPARYDPTATSYQTNICHVGG